MYKQEEGYTYIMTHSHNFINVGRECRDEIWLSIYKCSGCPATKFIHPQIKTFP